MKGFTGVTDNDWFLFLLIAHTFTEKCFEQKSVNSLLDQDLLGELPAKRA
jgi:hypothetical protein